jgi:hypothetical protein
LDADSQSEYSHDTDGGEEEWDEMSSRDEIIVPNDPSVITERTAFWPRDGYAEDWEQAGEEIGRHDYLEKLNFTTFTLSAAVTDALMRGVATNRSIRTLEFIWCNGMWDKTFDKLAPFIENNSKPHEIHVSG